MGILYVKLYYNYILNPWGNNSDVPMLDAR